MNSLREMIYYLFEHFGIVQEVILRDDVDEAAIYQAVKKAAEVHPWVKGVPYEKDGEIFFKETEEPFEAIKNNGPVPLDQEHTKGRLFEVTWFKNKIWITYVHLITDGTGRMLFYKTMMHFYFCIKNKKDYPVLDALIKKPEVSEQYADPFEKKLELSSDFTPKTNEKNNDIFKFPDREEIVKSAFHYNIEVNSSDFMTYVKSNGMTPTLCFELFFAKTIQKLFPENKKDFVSSIPVNIRKLTGSLLSFNNGFVSVSQNIKVSDLAKPESQLGKELRADFNEITSDDNLKVLINQTVENAMEAGKFHTAKEKYKSYCKTSDFEPATYIITYIGKFPITEYSDEILNSMWFSYANIPIFSMVDIGGKFSITANSLFDLSPCVEAIVKEFEEHGIKVLSKTNLGKVDFVSSTFFYNRND